MKQHFSSILCASAFAALLAGNMPSAAIAQDGPKLFTIDDEGKPISVGVGGISPDGSRVVYTVTRTDMSKDSSKTQIMLLNLANGQRRELFPQREGVGETTWSPDGSQIAFVAPKGEGKDAKAQIYLLPMTGGEARPVTKAANGVNGYAWRPDGRAFAYTSTDERPNKAAVEKHHDLFTVGDQDYLSQGPPVPTHLWLQVIDGGKAKRLTSGSWTVTSGPSWSHDGKFIGFARISDAYTGHWTSKRAVVMNVATGKMTELTHGNTYSDAPSFAPTGDRLIYAVGRQNLWAFGQQLMETSMANLGAARALAGNVDGDFQGGTWTPSGDLYVSADSHVTRLWYKIPSGATSAQPVSFGALLPSDVSVAKNGTIAMTLSGPATPGELYVLAPGSRAPKRMTNFNTWVHAYTVAPSKDFTWHNEGFLEDGLLTYPAHYVAGKKYPVILDIHGGPTWGASQQSLDIFHQSLAARGYFVFEPNYRGSDNLGFNYAKAWLGDPVAGPGRDVVAGVKALEATGMVDPNRIGVSGWSAGGWMTSWLITHYHIWKAAVSGAAVNDAVEEEDLNDITAYLPALLNGALPWTPSGRATYIATSPITFVRNVTTPTLILSDTGDYRVPAVQAYMFYHALKDLGKQVEFVAIPVVGHFPSDPVRVMDTNKVWADWMYSHLK